MEKLEQLISWFTGLTKRGKMLVVAGGALAVILVIELFR